jgi:sugar/nucleoside kinase (ribokinase family)
MRKVLLICLAVCFVLALSALAFDDMGKSATVKGWVVDDKCGAKGANDKAEACTKKCLAAGAKLVVVTDGDQKVLAVDNPDALKGHEGHHVAVTGHMGKDSIHVESAKML